MEIPKELKIDEKKALAYTIKWIKDYFKPLRSRKAVIGLSGGSDSTFTAYVCCLALGRENVLGVIMPSDSNPKEDEDDARLVAKVLGIKTKTINISAILAPIKKLNPELNKKINRVAMANIKARVRMLLLYKEANENKSIVAGTDDRSEHDLGYYTKYGDGGVDINVPEHLYKTQLRQILMYIGNIENFGIFKKIGEKIPSPRLWKGQTAENELSMSYKDIDRILYCVNEKMIISPAKISEITGIDKTRVIKIINTAKINQHKNRLPPSPAVKYFNVEVHKLK